MGRLGGPSNRDDSVLDEDVLVYGNRRGLRGVGLGWWVALAVLAALAAGGLWYAHRPHRATPVTVTYTGSVVGNAAEVITRTDAAFVTYVRDRHGVRSAHARCYFNRVGGWAETDVAPIIYCGPVLFYGGAAPDVWLRYVVTPSTARPGRQVRFTVGSHPEIETPVYLPRGATLERPDGRTAPAGTEGLVAPGPPPASRNILVHVSRADLPDLPAVPATSVIHSRTLDVRLMARGFVRSFGRDLAKRLPPAGQRLLAFELKFTQGELDPMSVEDPPGIGPVLALAVDDRAARRLPVSTYVDYGTGAQLTRFLVAAVPVDARQVTLVLTEDGITQRLSVLDGSPAGDNIAVLARDPVARAARVHFPRTALARIDEHGTERTAELLLSVSSTGLGFFSPFGSQHARGLDRALLNLEVYYYRYGQPPWGGSFGVSNLTLVPASGAPIRALDVGNTGYTVFDVPASFRGATVIVAGTGKDWSGHRVSLVRPFRIRITFGP